MIRYTFIATATLLFSATNVLAQNISLNFPHFAGQEWHITTFRGENTDTIATGQLDKAGKVQLIIAEDYKNYRGMMRWLLVKGGGLEMVVSGAENMSVFCTETQPSEESIIYSNSSENNYLRGHYARQQRILPKVDALRMAVKLYKEDKELLPVFEEELQKQERVYNRQQEETANNSLYAARFSQIVDVTRGLPQALSQGNENAELLVKNFIVHHMDMQALYTSGHWQTILSQWIEWYIHNPENESLLTEDYQTLKKRINEEAILSAFSESTQKILSESKRSDLALLTQ